MTLPDLAEITHHDGHRSELAQGLRIGNVFVRPAFQGETSVDVHTGAEYDSSNSWVVGLPLCGVSFAVVQSFDVALVIADEVSLHAPTIHEAREIDDLERIFVGPIAHWLRYALKCDVDGTAPLGFRRWWAE